MEEEPASPIAEFWMAASRGVADPPGVSNRYASHDAGPSTTIATSILLRRVLAD